jgi:hypothetical protein
MATLLFVHGTGEREPKKTTTMIKKKLASLQLRHLQSCYWGEACGVRLGNQWESIPEKNRPKKETTHLFNDEEKLWRVLEGVPLFGLRELAKQQSENYNVEDDRNELKQSYEALNFDQLVSEEPTIAILTSKDLAYLKEAKDENQQEIYACIDRLSDDIEEYQFRIAQAIVADAIGKGMVTNNDQRDQLVNRIKTALGGGEELGVINAIKGVTLGVMSYAAGWLADGNRSTVYDFGIPGIGDILVYQTRGLAGRQYIYDTIANIQDDVILLAHSLGGIACVDLLIEQQENNAFLQKIKGLITVGSQAPFLYEINALSSLPYQHNPPKSPLPDNFPKWLNIFDEQDLLSFKAENVFNNPVQIKDCPIRSKKFFPESHTHYFKEKSEAWRKIREWIEVL